MRIIGGRWRSRKIAWPRARDTRPITDRVRESVFDLLGSRFGTPGALPGIKVADVFAGGGSLGLEALSRGAARVCFFDQAPEAIEALKHNLERLGAGPEATIVVADVWRTGVRPPPSCAPLELVFLDPPFADSREMLKVSKVASLLRRMGAGKAVSDAALVVFRHERRVNVPETFGRYWTVQEQRAYGRSAVSLLVRRAPEPATDAADAASAGQEDEDGLATGR
jgi:16S rRNA (guanine966-N2)-methyltransferase